MPLEIPTRSEVTSQGEAYVRSEVPELDPSTSRRSYVGGMVKAFMLSLHDFYVALRKATLEFFPQTATQDFLTTGWWVDITGLTRNPAAPARGNIVVTGAAGGTVTAGAAVVANNVGYTVDAGIIIADQQLAISSLTFSGGTATAETVTARHLLATGMSVTISGANEADYNGTFTITATAENEFTYAVSGSPSSPATGSIVLASTYGMGAVTCDTNGTDGNLTSGAIMTLSAPGVGVDASAIVTFGDLAGGAEQETIDAYRERVIEGLGTDFGMFSADEIQIIAKQITGVTRVWVNEATLNGTNGVYEGQVKIAFMRDQDSNPFPSAAEVATVKGHIVSQIMPAHTAEEDVMVMSPDELLVPVTFSALSPDTPTMRQAIKARLNQFFDEAIEYETDIPLIDIECAIKDAYSPEDRSSPVTFTLTSPTGVTTVTSNELPRIGAVTFP